MKYTITQHEVDLDTLALYAADAYLMESGFVEAAKYEYLYYAEDNGGAIEEALDGIIDFCFGQVKSWTGCGNEHLDFLDRDWACEYLTNQTLEEYTSN